MTLADDPFQFYRHAKMKLDWIKNGDGGGGKEKVCGSKKNNEDVDKLV